MRCQMEGEDFELQWLCVEKLQVKIWDTWTITVKKA